MESKPLFTTRICKPLNVDMGVYAIVAIPLQTGITKALIGSSRRIAARIEDHLRHLKYGYHYNRELSDAFESGEYEITTHLIEGSNDLKHGECLELEMAYINKFAPISLFNKNFPAELKEIRPWLDKSVKKINESKYTVSDSGCWEWNRIDPRKGYGKQITTSIGGRIRYFIPHRLSYYKETGEYPPLLRHLCDNKKCINPDHLLGGSYQQNGLDKSREFRKTFEKIWLHYLGNTRKITKHFNWAAENQSLDISPQVYYWEKQLGLREKYETVLIENGRKFVTPSHFEEIQREKNRIKREKQELKERKDYVETLRGEAENLKRRYSASSTELAQYFDITPQEAYRLIAGIKPVYDTFCSIVDSRFYDEFIVSYRRREEQVEHIQVLFDWYPDQISVIEDYYARNIFQEEADAFCNFRREKYLSEKIG